MKVVSIEFTMYNVPGEQTFIDTTIRGAIQRLRHQCATVIIHKTTEFDCEIIKQESFIVDEKFEIVPKHEQNKITN